MFDPLTNAQNSLVNILPLDEQVEMGGIFVFFMLETVKKIRRDLFFCAYIQYRRRIRFLIHIFRVALGSRVSFLLCRKPGHLGARRTTVLADAGA